MYNICLFYLHIYISIFCSRLPRWLSGKGIHLSMQETQVWSLGWKDTLEEEMITYIRILDWRIPCTWWATVHRITAESGMTEQFCSRPLRMETRALSFYLQHTEGSLIKKTLRNVCWLLVRTHCLDSINHRFKQRSNTNSEPVFWMFFN